MNQQIEPTPNEETIQYVFLDTNILQYISNEDLATEIINFILALKNQGFTLAISNVSICELLSGCTIAQEEKSLKYLNIFQRFNVDETVLIGAARLQNIYKTQKIPDSQINLADRIIASTTIITGSYILTGDVNDYPRPLFSEIFEKPIFYTKKNKTNLQVIQLLQPNHLLIQHLLNTRQ